MSGSVLSPLGVLLPLILHGDNIIVPFYRR